jgi:hypothetical protein
MQTHLTPQKRHTERLLHLVTLAASLSLLAGCGGRVASPPVANAIAIQIIPVGVWTNVYVPAGPGVEYGVVTDNLGLLYLQGLLPE